MTNHICDNRCLGESGHHSWPAPHKYECLCGQKFNGEPVWCPMHKRTGGKRPLLVAPPKKPYLKIRFKGDKEIYDKIATFVHSLNEPDLTVEFDYHLGKSKGYYGKHPKSQEN